MVNRVMPFEQPLSEHADEVIAHEQRFLEIREITILVPVEHVATAGLGPGLPSELKLAFLRDGRLRVRVPIAVKIMAEGEHFIAEATQFNEFGFGKNQGEALAELQRVIAELYFTLEETQEQLGSDLRDVWSTLQQYIQKR